MIFYGIADAHGLESFQPATFEGEWEGFQIPSKDLSILSYRAQGNRHRHAVVFQVEVDLKTASSVLDLLKAGEYAEALTTLKEGASRVELMRTPGAAKSWKLIPNSDLDPYFE